MSKFLAIAATLKAILIAASVALARGDMLSVILISAIENIDAQLSVQQAGLSADARCSQFMHPVSELSSELLREASRPSRTKNQTIASDANGSNANEGVSKCLVFQLSPPQPFCWR
jgi:hypothetical protein